ncbi:ABC transporter ATP-binding protein [bacterium]|nr:ABC transporter ATP-binding protein [bacterium]
MIKRFVQYYGPHKKIFALDMIASFLVAVIGMVYPIVTRYMLNDWIPNQKINLIIIGGSSLLLAYLMRLGLRYFIQFYGHIMGVRMQADMRRDMFNKLQKLPYSYFDKEETGSIMSRLTNDLFDISELAHHGPENVFIAGFTLICSFVYLLTINWILALILFISVPLCFLVSVRFRIRMRDGSRKSKVAMAKINASTESSISGIRVTKAFTNSDIEKEKFEESNTEFIKARTIFFKSMGAFFSISQFITDLFNVIILITGGVFLFLNYINLGDYTTFVVSVSMFISPINQLIQFTEQYQSGAAGFKRFIEVMDENEEIDNKDAIECEGLKGEIDFKNVSFKYTESYDVLNDVSFKIEKGKTIALVGPSGGGKTTICHLIPRFYEYESGSISIDGIPITSFTHDSLRRNIGIVQQDVFLFSGSIKENIRYGKLDATDEELLVAAKRANIMEFIESLPDGWDTEIGERGVRLSGGQKQRLSIARVFLKNPPILILDEATSALDNTTEMLIQASLNELAKGRTTIVVAHRLSTIKNADEIIVISEGKIREKGTHDELIKNDDSIYKKLYDLQFKDSLDARINIPF